MIKNAQNKNVPVEFRENAQIDTEISKEIAIDRVEDKIEKYRDVWVVLVLDNL